MQIELENVCLKFWEIIQRVLEFLFKLGLFLPGIKQQLFLLFSYNVHTKA